MNKRSDNLRQYRHETTLRFLLEAAEAVMVRQGFDCVTMRDIAAQAGCAPGTLYLYFKSKQDVLDAIIRRHSTVLLDQLSAALAKPGEATARLRRVHRLLIAYMNRHQSIIRLLYTGQLLGPGAPPAAGFPAHIRADWERFMKNERGVIRKAQAAGRIRRDYPPEAIQAFMTFVMLGLRDEVVAQGRVPSGAEQEAMVWEMLTGGIGGTEPHSHAKR